MAGMIASEWLVWSVDSVAKTFHYRRLTCNLTKQRDYTGNISHVLVLLSGWGGGRPGASIRAKCTEFVYQGAEFEKKQRLTIDTVDGWNPAPPRMMIIPLFIGFHTSQVVQDFSHQQYGLFWSWFWSLCSSENWIQEKDSGAGIRWECLNLEISGDKELLFNCIHPGTPPMKVIVTWGYVGFFPFPVIVPPGSLHF